MRGEAGEQGAGPLGQQHHLPVVIEPQRAEFLVAKAEVSQLAGALDEAEDSLRRALRFYDDRQMVLLAERTRALLASLATQRNATPRAER